MSLFGGWRQKDEGKSRAAWKGKAAKRGLMARASEHRLLAKSMQARFAFCQRSA